jgi:hypothetical protein
MASPIVIPAQAGIHAEEARAADEWIPAFVGMTSNRLHQPRLIEGGLDERGE